MRSFIIVVSFLVFAAVLAGCKDDEAAPPSINHSTITLHITYVIDQTYSGWAWSRSARPIISGDIAMTPTRYAASQRHELENCQTAYNIGQCDWRTALTVLDDSREIDLKLDERFTLHNPLVHVHLPLNESLFHPQAIPGRGGQLTVWADRSL